MLMGLMSGFIYAILIYANNSEDYTATQYTQIPPSPEVASLMKYIDIPVSHFTGLPQINIPLYTITEGSLKIPISLSYRGGGIKQDEQPGIISKGWSLNAGATISRTVYGLCNVICGVNVCVFGKVLRILQRN